MHKRRIIMHNWQTWTKRLLLALAIFAAINTYGYGFHLFLERDEPTPMFRLTEFGDFDWMMGGTHLPEGQEYFIRMKRTSMGSGGSFGTVDYDNLGPINFDGTNSTPYFDDDGFEGGS